MSIEIKNVSAIYSPQTAFEKIAVEQVNLTIKHGEFIGLIGHTGSGKSTLIQHLNALLRPTYGQILFDGVDINADKSNLKSIRQQVGLVFQYPEHQLFETSIYKDVAFGPLNLGLAPDAIDVRVKEALTMVGIEESLYEKSPFELSGGQKRRVAIAGVLAMKPKVLVLDEPTAGLDPRGRDEILENIRSMQKALGITVILVSHSMEDVSRLVDRIIVMNQGKVVYDAPPAAVFVHAAELEKIGLGAPQITVLMQALRKAGIDVPDDVFTVEEATDILFRIWKQKAGVK